MSYFISFLNLLVSLFLLSAITYIYKKKAEQLLNKKKKLNYRIIKSTKDFLQYFEFLKQSKIIGIDTEYHKGKKYKGTLCLIQLYIQNFSFALIIDLISLSETSKLEIGKLLNEILSDNKIEKVFHACYNDIEWIKDEFGIEIHNIFDTQEMHQIASHSNTHLKNLVDLLKIYLNINMNNEEKKKFQTSNWYERPLKQNQLIYAANDSLFLIKLRNKIAEKINDDKKIEEEKKKFEFNLYNSSKKEKNIKQANNFFIDNLTKINTDYFNNIKKLFSDLINLTDEYSKEQNINSELILNMKTIYKICVKLPKTKEEILEILSTKYSEETIKTHKNFYDKISSFIISKTENLEKQEKNLTLSETSKKNELLRNLKKKANRQSTLEKFSCKSPIYENCKMLAPDGQQLCFCDYKKMTWYVSRNLAEIISEDPPVFRLFFEPNARGCKDENDKSSNFYITSRTNCCVICGQEKDYLRFHIIPLIYRSCFPENLKSHKSHDVVLLCLSCHERARLVYEKKKKEISNKYNVPLNVLSDGKVNYLKLQQFQKKCKVLLRVKNPLPEEAKNKIKKNLINSFTELMSSFDSFKEFVEENEIKCEKEEDINDKFCELFSEKFEIGENMGNKKNMHGQLVLEKVKDLKEFIREWRKFFVDSFNPQFLPSEWSIDHEIVRTFGEHSNFKNKKNFMDNKSIQKNK